MSAKPNYDLIVVLLSMNDERYLKRLESFRQYGLLNIGQHRIKNILLHSGPPVPDAILKNWPCDVQVVRFEQTGPTHKFATFFAANASGLADEARWIAKWDDDSVTDVGGLLDALDSEFCCEDALYLVAHFVPRVPEEIKVILQDMGLRHLTRRAAHGKFILACEWEGSVMTSAALRRIAASPRSVEFLRRCALQAPASYGDQPIAVAARLARVHPIDVPFMTKDDAWEDFTLFGGRHAHVHYLAPDKGERWNQFVSFYEKWKAEK